MASARVIRDLGETLRAIVFAGVQPSVPNVTVTLATPDEFASFQNPQDPVVTIFLHRIAVHPEMRNAPPRRLPNGATSRPQLPLEVSFMITPWARQTADEYVLAGLVLQTLYENSEVGAGWLQGTAWESGDSVQLILESLGSEDHYRVWDTVSLAYRLSLTYLARVVGIEPRPEVLAVPVGAGHIGSSP